MNAWIDNLLTFYNGQELLQCFRIVLALILGGVIGFERERHARPAGLRTHVLVSLASALAMLVSKYGFEGFDADASRIAAQVISGIGFIGAGCVIFSDRTIKGITTASTIWICSIIGLACGDGYYFGAILTTALVIFTLNILIKVEFRISGRKSRMSTLKVVVEETDKSLEVLEKLMKKGDVEIGDYEYRKVQYNGVNAIEFDFLVRESETYVNSSSFTKQLKHEFNVLDFRCSKMDRL